MLEEQDSIELLKTVAENDQNPFEQAWPLGHKVFDDALLGGVRAGDLVVISGVSGHGKTSFAQSITYNFSLQSIPSLWFSYEVSVVHLQRKFSNMSSDIRVLPVYSPRKTTSGRVDWIAEKIREAKKNFDCRMVFIDHLDFLMPSAIKSSENEALYLRRIVMELKSVAIQAGVTIFLMAHVRKVIEEPQMADIANSAAIFQNADVVFMVYRIPANPGSGLQYSGDLFTNQTKIKMVKNRVTGQSKFIIAEMHQERFIEVVDDLESLVG